MSPRRARAVDGRVGDDPAAALREHLIDATEQLIGKLPVSAVTTRDIARAAEVSDGVLYNYFEDKSALILAALVQHYRRLATRFYASLPQPGTGTVEDNLVLFASGLLELIGEALPTIASLVTQPQLFHRLFEEIHRDAFSPEDMQRRLTQYLEAERDLGRLSARNLSPAGPLLMGTVLTLALSYHFVSMPDHQALQGPEALIDQLRPTVAAILRGLE